LFDNPFCLSYLHVQESNHQNPKIFKKMKKTLICKPLFKPLAKKPPKGAMILAKMENTAA
jgi:hypothetical protein